MWPMYVDYSDEECKRVLRSLELEAYASVVNAFRAQGNLTKDRKKMLQDLCSLLSIPIERHRAELRRAVNDEHLNTIAERLAGPNTSTEWTIEGRRVVPLMQRLAPQTVFTEIANSVASAQAVKNASLPVPGKTGLREVSNGIETMASRKRRDYTLDSAISPQKIPALDSQYFHNLFCSDSFGSSPMDTSPQLPEAGTNSESARPERTPLAPSPSFDWNLELNRHKHELNPPSINSTSKPAKNPLPKSFPTTSTLTTYDLMPSNLLTSRGTSQAPAVNSKDQAPKVSDKVKPPGELKSAQRQPSSAASLKSTIVIPNVAAPASSASSPKERMPTPPTTPQNTKFLNQLRSKAPPHARQNLPAGLGIKVATQTQVSQRAAVPIPKPAGTKAKHDSGNVISKKTPPSGLANVPDNKPTQFPVNLPPSDTVAITKSPLSVTKSSPKLESGSSVLSGQPVVSKQSPVSKSLPKTSPTVTTTTQNSAAISRSLFTTPSKTAAKPLSPVIFNVASTTGSTVPTTTKTTTQVSGEVGKPSPHLLPKSTSVGITSSHLKITSSNAQTIQYRNDGGLVRSARIVNISQPVGSRLPCAISPSAISALGLSNTLSTTALRVTLPAGTLNTSSALRVSAAAKPNVIVVHKAQMWPRSQQGGTVIMSSTPLSKVSNDVVQETIIANKQDKKTISGPKQVPRTIAPARPQSPAVSLTSIRIPEASLVQSSSLPDSTTSEVQSSKISENPIEIPCKKNLLADVMEESGLMDSQSTKLPKEKGNGIKNIKDTMPILNHIELEASLTSKSSASSSEPSKPLPESSSSKVDCTSKTVGDSLLSLIDKNGVSSQLSETQPPIEINIAEVFSSNGENEALASSDDLCLLALRDLSKDEDS